MIVNSYTISDYRFSNTFIEHLFNDCVYFDIETTGLSPRIDSIISITLLLKEDDEIKLYQLFCKSPLTEEQVLNKFNSLIANKKYLITYNGNSFDIPFLKSKLNKYNIYNELDSFYKIDLYKDIRILQSCLHIDNMKLKTIEKYFNIHRNDTLSGKDIITLYNSYQISNKKEHMELILLHNYEDVYNLPIIFDNILNLYDKCSYISNSTYFILLKTVNKNISINKKQLRITVDLITNISLNYSGHGTYYDFEYHTDSGLCNIKIYPEFYNDDNIKEFLYKNNEDVNLSSYTSIRNLKKEIIPLKYNTTIFYNNIYAIIEKIIRNIIN